MMARMEQQLADYAKRIAKLEQELQMTVWYLTRAHKRFLLGAVAINYIKVAVQLIFGAC